MKQCAEFNSRFAEVTEKEILRMLAFLECVVLSPNLYNYANMVQLFSSISVSSGSFLDMLPLFTLKFTSENNC